MLFDFFHAYVTGTIINTWLNFTNSLLLVIGMYNKGYSWFSVDTAWPRNTKIFGFKRDKKSNNFIYTKQST